MSKEVDYYDRKADQGKRRYDLVPVEPIEMLADILTFGAAKYSDWSWREVPDATERYYAALMRHIVEWRKGNKMDDESGLPHLAHALTNIVFLLELEKEGNKSVVSEVSGM